MTQFEPRPQKVHLYQNNAGVLSHKGGRQVDSTACKSNHGDAKLLVTDDHKKVTCKRCLRRMNGENWMGKPLRQTEEVRLTTLRLETMKVDLEAAQAKFEEERTKRIQAEVREKEAWKAADKERQEANLLRNGIHDLEIDYARLRGYVDGQLDLEAPRMVPERREPRLASYPDGTMRFRVATPYSAEPDRNWYERR